MIAPVARWCEGLHGRAPIKEALGSIVTALKAEAAALSRAPLDCSRRTTSVVYDTVKVSSGTALEQSYARALLGDCLGKAKPGLVWYKSAAGAGIAPALDRFHAQRQLAELAVLPLTADGRSTDVLELHFSARPGPVQQALLNIIAGTLVRTWANRTPGLYMEACLRTRPAGRPAAPSSQLLSMDNPAQLSRAEYRVCLMLSEGRGTERVQAQLGISKSTLRTHLRNIYAKTGTNTLNELVRQLVPPEPARRQTGSAA
ncbi:helix-turn-helix transcriptional regulator [Roseobacteraceae bacterium NS-SX3]